MKCDLPSPLSSRETSDIPLLGASSGGFSIGIVFLSPLSFQVVSRRSGLLVVQNKMLLSQLILSLVLVWLFPVIWRTWLNIWIGKGILYGCFGLLGTPEYHVRVQSHCDWLWWIGFTLPARLIVTFVRPEHEYKLCGVRPQPSPLVKHQSMYLYFPFLALEKVNSVGMALIERRVLQNYKITTVNQSKIPMRCLQAVLFSQVGQNEHRAIRLWSNDRSLMNIFVYTMLVVYQAILFCARCLMMRMTLIPILTHQVYSDGGTKLE